MDDGSVGMDVDTHEAVWGLGAEAAREARGEFDLDGAFLAAVQKYGTKVFPAAEVREDDPWFEEFFQAFREGAESALPRTAQMDDEPEEEMENPTIYLDNLDYDDGMVTVHISGPGAAAWAKHDQSIQGSMWETDGDDFAYSIIMDSPTLVEELTKDGYNVDDSEYSAPTLEELQALDPMNR
jgi:hypothetical protein